MLLLLLMNHVCQYSSILYIPVLFYAYSLMRCLQEDYIYGQCYEWDSRI